MGHSRGNANNIPRGKLLSDTTLDRAVTLFMGSHRLSIQKRATDDEGCGTGFHEEDIRLSFVPLHLAVSLSMDQQKAVTREIGQLLYRKMVRIGCGVIVQPFAMTL